MCLSVADERAERRESCTDPVTVPRDGAVHAGRWAGCVAVKPSAAYGRAGFAQAASLPAPPTSAPRGRTLPYFVPNFSPPPPCGLHSTLPPCRRQVAFTAKQREEKEQKP